MKGSINERVKKIRESLSLDQNTIAESIGLKQGSYSSMETTAKSISGSVLKLLEILYNVNIDYLLNGKGEMFKKKQQNMQIAQEPNTSYGKEAEIIKLLNNTIRSLETTIKAQEITIDLLQKKAEPKMQYEKTIKK